MNSRQDLLADKNKYREWTPYQWDFGVCTWENTYIKYFTAPSIQGFLFVRDDDHFTYTCSFGPNSDYSLTGCFFRPDVVVEDVHEAMRRLDIMVPLYLRGERLNVNV